MRRALGVSLVVVLVAAGGCAAVGGSDDPVRFGTETRGDTTFVYFQPEGTALPADTVVRINTTIPGGENRSGRLGQRVDPGTNVYPGGPITGAAATDFAVGGPPAVAQIPRPLYFEVEVKLTVETENVSVSETFTFGGQGD